MGNTQNNATEYDAEWACDACTFINKNSGSKCEMCDTLKTKQFRIRNVRNRNRFVTAINALDNQSDNKNDEDMDKYTTSYGFGEHFNYWDKKSIEYVPQKYISLRDEMLNNNKHKMEKNEWTDFVQKANKIYRQMYKNKNMQQYALYAKNKGYFNKLSGIQSGSKLTIDHILSIIIYTDTTDLQTILKQQCRKMHSNETITDIRLKNSEFHNWLKLLSEVIVLFGKKLKPEQFVYHGLSVKFLFDKFEYDFRTPLSTTTDIAVAQRFCDGNDGIILKLKASSNAESYICTQFFSQYPTEKEYLFFGCDLKIISLITPNGTNYDEEVKVLNLFFNILSGCILDRNDLFKDNSSKNLLIKYINKHINCLKGIKSDKDINVNEYIWRLFINFTSSNKQIWINLAEMKYLKQTEGRSLSEKFILFNDDNDEYQYGIYYLSLLENKLLNLKISYTNQYEWVIKENELKKLLNGEYNKLGIRCNDNWNFYINDQVFIFNGNMMYDVYDSNKYSKIGFCLTLVKMPQTYKSINVSFQLYCEQINFSSHTRDVIMTDIRHSKDGLKHVGDSSLFMASKLNNFNSFKWKVMIKCV